MTEGTQEVYPPGNVGGRNTNVNLGKGHGVHFGKELDVMGTFFRFRPRLLDFFSSSFQITLTSHWIDVAFGNKGPLWFHLSQRCQISTIIGDDKYFGNQRLEFGFRNVLLQWNVGGMSNGKGKVITGTQSMIVAHGMARTLTIFRQGTPQSCNEAAFEQMSINGIVSRVGQKKFFAKLSSILHGRFKFGRIPLDKSSIAFGIFYHDILFVQSNGFHVLF
mmetsp:Transcript_29765/g.45118  ORF Transcript_29765/g.45118 Transcript_29765/m.45118 type:complete len:219 (-) Transcript_29765:579-1235(-)